MAGRRCIQMNRKSKLHQRKIKKEKPDKKARRAVLDEKRWMMRLINSRIRGSISDATKKKVSAVLKKRRDKHPQIAAAESSLRSSIKFDCEMCLEKIDDGEEDYLRDYKGKTNFQRTKTRYLQHLFQWFIKKHPPRKDEPHAATARLFKSIVFKDPNTEIELGLATNFKCAGQLLEIAEEMGL
jgi:hypothetical protein